MEAVGAPKHSSASSATEKDAEIYAVQMAKKWIDDNG